MTGHDLRVERTKARMTAEDVARHMGVTRARVSAIESRERPTEAAVSRYLAAIVASNTARSGAAMEEYRR